MIYEDSIIDYLSLSIHKDNVGLDTLLYYPKHFLSELSDEEILMLFNIKATFISGKNANIRKESVKNIAYFDDKFGISFNIDSRIDNNVGKRMRAINKNDEMILNKIREIILDSKEVERFGGEGSFLIIANKKVLHAREAFKYINSAEVDSIESAPRVLIRSKGVDFNKIQGALYA